MGPFFTKPCDDIVVLFEAPSDSSCGVQGTYSYNLIGDAYAMDGEFVKAATPNDYRAFVLA